jgi:hypothetical protein
MASFSFFYLNVRNRQKSYGDSPGEYAGSGDAAIFLPVKYWRMGRTVWQLAAPKFPLFPRSSPLNGLSQTLQGFFEKRSIIDLTSGNKFRTINSFRVEERSYMENVLSRTSLP